MKILVCCTKEDAEADGSYLQRLQRLSNMRGVQIGKTTQVYENPVTLGVIAKKYGMDAIICTQPTTIQAILNDTPDYTRTAKREKFSTTQYAGSLLKLRNGIEVLCLDSLVRLRTVPEERYVVDRFVSKLTAPSSWLPATKFQWKLVTQDSAAAILEKIRAADLVAIDIENPHPQVELRPITCTSYTTYSFATHTTESYVVPFDDVWCWEFMVAANDSPPPKVFQNGLHDNSYFMRWGCPVRNWLFDTFHLAHSWQVELPRTLNFLAAFFIREVRYWKDDGKTGQLFDLHRYNALDGWGTINSLLGLMQLYPQYAAYNYVEHEFPVVFPALHAAMEGMECDKERFMAIKEKKEAHVAQLLSNVRTMLDEPQYNPGSWQQNEKVFKLLGCGDLQGTGKIPTLHAKARHPINERVLTDIEDYKKEAKQVGTYFDPDKLWNGRIYYGLNPGGTDTLRLASKESSFDCGWQIQNIPAADQSFKECVLAPEGWFIAEADKKQSEARCVGYMSGDLNLINLVESPHDYHSWNASAFFGIKYELIFDEATGKTLMKPLRDLSKRTNHGANYNMSAPVLLDTMGPKKVAEAKITLKLPGNLSLLRVCQYLLTRYEQTYPAVKGRWYNSIVYDIETTGKLVSPMGWTRIFHAKPKDSKPAMNSAVAHGPQNLSVSIVNKEWRTIWHETVYGSLRGKVRIKAQIHDSLLFIYKKLEDAERVQELMRYPVQVICSAGITRTLIIPTDLSTGDKPTRRWSDIK